MTAPTRPKAPAGDRDRSLEAVDLAQRGSQVVAALEDLWGAVRRHHPELPPVVMVTGTGVTKWGHVGVERWDLGEDGIGAEGRVRSAERGSMTEMMIAGERLACGATLTAQTMLHEGAHVLAHLRGKKDTSRQNRYHNKAFVRLAEELGLEWPTGAEPDTSIGFSDVRIRPETVERYRPEIEALGEAIQLYVPLDPWLARYLGLAAPQEGDEGNALGGGLLPAGESGQAGVEGGDGVDVTTLLGKRQPRRTGPTKARNLSVATCRCEEPRKLRIAPRTLEQAPVICGACNEEFQYRED